MKTAQFLTRLCPKCKSDNLALDTGGQTGKYFCKRCGYLGALIIENYKKQTKNKRINPKKHRAKIK